MNPNDVDERIAELMDEIEGFIEDVPSAQRSLTMNMLHTYCWYEVNIQTVEQQINEEGLIVFTENGPRDNPKLSVMNKLSQQKSTYYTKIMKEIKSMSSDGGDSLSNFLRG